MFRKLFRFIRTIFILLWFVSVLVIGGWVTFYNTDKISVNLLGMELYSLSVGTYLCLFFAFGVTLGWFGTWLLARAKLFARQRELGRTKKEVEKLRKTQVEQG